jgi:hypothetical protein
MPELICDLTVVDQIIYNSSSIDIVADSRNILKTRFTFKGDVWSGLTKTALFIAPDGTAYKVLLVDDMCVVPHEVIKAPSFGVSVYGGDLMTASLYLVTVHESGYTDAGVDPAEPTPDVYNQMIAAFEAAKAEAAESAQTATEKAGEASTSAGQAFTYSQTAATAKDLAEDYKNDASTYKSQAKDYKDEAAAIEERVSEAEQRVIALMATDTKSYFFATLAERDAYEGFKHCDRCSVLETRADYIYDTRDTDGDTVNPEWIKTSDWDALKTVAWSIITGKPEFAAVATSGSYDDLSDKPAWHRAPVVLNGTGDTVLWDYSLSDAAVVTLTEDKEIEITNLYAGAEGVIQVYGTGALLIPEEQQSATFGMLTPIEGQEHATYAFYSRDGLSLDWVMMPFKGATV